MSNMKGSKMTSSKMSSSKISRRKMGRSMSTCKVFPQVGFNYGDYLDYFTTTSAAACQVTARDTTVGQVTARDGC